MALLNDNIRKQLRDAFDQLEAPVRILTFTQGEGGALECDLCAENRTLIEEVAALSPRISLEVLDFVADAPIATQYGVDKIPATVILSDGDTPTDYGIRLYGIPSGYEFTTLVEDILMVSRGESGLNARTLQELARLTQPVHIRVFVTPTCPYCPQAVLLAHRLAMASELITAEMVEAMEFPHLANRYQVYGVPRTVINDVIHVEGAAPEATLVGRLMAVADPVKMGQLTAEWQASLN
jgi:glutaredoxin-like protein